MQSPHRIAIDNSTFYKIYFCSLFSAVIQLSCSRRHWQSQKIAWWTVNSLAVLYSTINLTAITVKWTVYSPTLWSAARTWPILKIACGFLIFPILNNSTKVSICWTTSAAKLNSMIESSSPECWVDPAVTESEVQLVEFSSGHQEKTYLAIDHQLFI